MKSEEEAGRAIEQYADMVRRICMIHLKNYEDAEDIFQTVFLKYVLRSEPFDSPEHEKAWIIRVTVNACRDLLKSFFRSRTVALDQLIERFRDVVYLHYYEGYSAPEIGRILKKNTNTVYTLLARARQLLKTRLEGVIEDE